MNRLKALIRSVFAFSRSETNGFLILLPLMALIIFSEPAYRYWFVRQPQDFSRDSVRLDSLIATWKWEKKQEESDEADEAKVVLAPFNPNKASTADLANIGFSTSLANRIINYRNKGGKFAIKSDLLKMYGMDTLFYKRIYSFIDLPEEQPTKNTSAKDVLAEAKKSSKAKLDLNLADTTQLDKVYGIGKKLSERIVKYRNRLGGFVSTNQLKEVYGLDSIAIKNVLERFVVAEDYQPTKININTSSDKELGSHPYLSFKLAKAIVAYRFQHGRFSSLNDLTKVQVLSEEDFRRIKPYLTLE
jgi:competence protein ComEA